MEQETEPPNLSDAEKLLPLYVYNYLMKKGFHKTAAAFIEEGGVEKKQIITQPIVYINSTIL